MKGTDIFCLFLALFAIAAFIFTRNQVCFVVVFVSIILLPLGRFVSKTIDGR